MKSLVLYCNYSKEKKEFEGKQEVDTCRLHDKNNVEFHINLWKIKNGVIRITPSLIFDFGIKFSNDITELCLFLPFRVPSHNGVKDLGGMLVNQSRLIKCSV